MQLRHYQNNAVEAIEAEWNKGNKRTLLVLPTGAGKTICFCRLAENVVREGGRVLILAHRGELLQQAADKLVRVTGLGCSVEKAESTSAGEWYRVVVGSVQTMTRHNRLSAFAPDHFDVIIVDEAHHAISDSYQRVLKHFEPASVLGVTATPDRGDMKELGSYFNSLAYEYTLPRAIKDGFLSPIKALTIPVKINLSSVKQTAGDYNAAEVGNALDPYLHEIADHMADKCQDRKTVVFLPLIDTSKRFRDLLIERGMSVAEVNGESKDRAEILRDFDQGRYQALCNSMLLTEGWDCPSVDCIVCLRPTRIRSLYCQMVGRGTRIHPGKDHLLLLDFLWLSEKHELCRPAHLLSPDKEVADKMTENLAAGCKPVGLEEAELQAESDCVSLREKALADQLAAQRKKKSKLVDPLQYAMSIQDADLVNYVPSFGWETKPADGILLDALEAAGIAPAPSMEAGAAERLLCAISDRRSHGLTTPKQIRFLEGKGFKHVGTWEFNSAKKLIDRIAMNSWRVPHGVIPAQYQPSKGVAV